MAAGTGSAVRLRRGTGLALSVAALVAGLAATAGAAERPRAGRLAEPLFFLEGMQGRETVDVADRLGLNAMQYKLPLDAPQILPEIRRELAGYAEAGLKIVLQIPTSFEIKQRIDLSNKAYWRDYETYINTVVPALRDVPGLAAWQTDDYLEVAIAYSAGDLQTFLEQRYGTAEALNGAWGTKFAGFGAITRDAALASDAGEPWGVGPASVDVADEQVDVFGQIMARWATAIRRYDPRTPLMTGRISLYRSLASVPPSYDVVLPAIRPDVMEDDPLTGNVHEVDLARRGGRFEVIPSLFVPMSPNPLFYAGAAQYWAMEAAAHGARGFAIEDWTRLISSATEGRPEPRPLEPRRVDERIAVLGRQLGPVASAAVFGQRPRPNYAFLWTPYAGGLEVAKVPAYGYLDTWSPGEPGTLFYLFRRGCAYGTADVLTPADLAATDLDQYGAILAPQALSTPLPVATALEDWVASGGLLVADVGLGMYQGGGWLSIVPPLSTITGLARFADGAMKTGPWQVVRGSALIPGLPPGAEARGVPVERRGVASATERKPRPYEGWLQYCAPPPDVETIAIADTKPTADKKGRLVGGIFGRRHGEGGGVYASFRLWDKWDPTDPLFATFHDSVCARRASYRLAGGFWPGGASLAVEEDGAVIVTRGAGTVELMALAARSALYEGAYCYTDAGIGDVDLLLDAPGGGLYHLRRMPMAVRPYGGRCLAKVELVGPKALQVMLYGDQAQVRQGPTGVKILRPLANDVQVVVAGGSYPIAPGSAQRVTVAEEGRKTVQQVVTADSAGRVDLTVRAHRTRLTLEPAPVR